VNGAPTIALNHTLPADYPRGPSNLAFVTDGIASAIQRARAVARGSDIKLGGASPGKQALAAGLCDEILIHLAPYVLAVGCGFSMRCPTVSGSTSCRSATARSLPIYATGYTVINERGSTSERGI
jgi:hypothetical protein